MKKILLFTTGAILALFLILFLLAGALYYTTDMKQPEIAARPGGELIWKGDTLTYGNNTLYRNSFGLWELTVSGEAFERGYAAGKLMPDLLYRQEKVFVDEIRKIIPSDSYLKFLRFMLVLFNRKLGDYVPEENRREIYGISLSCTDEFNAIGTPYERQLNYHAAHDIGHAMQDYMLVGCSSFAIWGSQSADSSLLIGRNFDFYVGDAFAEQKLITFCRPDEGYRFISVGWPGMTGVLSGMNAEGLTVTINAAKSAIPTSAAMPISILARQILQYAKNIDEAYHIAEKYQTFVSESLLIGSAADGRAAIIEKSPKQTALFTTEGNHIVCTNHFQSEAFANDRRNKENIATSDSPYRFARLEELIPLYWSIGPLQAAEILRDYRGLKEADIGLPSERAINQFIAHHSVIFQPEKGIMWVSTAPWQLGPYVAYTLDGRIHTALIPPDFFLQSDLYQQLLMKRHAKK